MKMYVPLCQTYKPTVIKKLILNKVDQHRGDNRLIHGAKHRKDNQWQSRELPGKIF